MQELRDRVLSEGRNLGRGILKVDSFINHQVDADLMLVVGRELAHRFSGISINKVLTAEIASAGLSRKVWQYFAVLTPVQTVGVMGDGRTYQNAVAVRAVVSEDGMTADWARLPANVLARISSRIVNEVPGVSRVV